MTPKGKRQPMIRQLQPIQWGQINDGDAFCIDAVDFIFVWNGKLANRLEKLQAAKVSLGVYFLRILFLFFGRLYYCDSDFIES